MSGAHLIVTSPDVRGGEPRFVDTRIAVQHVLDYLASGMTHDEILADLPTLTEEHLDAALEFGQR